MTGQCEETDGMMGQCEKTDGIMGLCMWMMGVWGQRPQQADGGAEGEGASLRAAVP